MTRSEVAYAIFHEMMQVDVSTRFVTPPAFLKKFPLTMHEDVNAQIKHQQGTTTVLRSIAGIAMLLDDGCEIYYKNMDQLVRSFRLIKQHLANWVEEMQTPFGRNPPPDEDLLLLNNLAEHLAHAAHKHILHEELANDLIRGSLGDDDDPFSYYRGAFAKETRYSIHGQISKEPIKEYVSPLIEFWANRGLQD